MPLPKVWNDYDRLDAADLNADMAYLDTKTPELAYTTITAPVTVAALTEAAATVVITAPAVTVDGLTVVEVEFGSLHVAAPAAASAGILLALFLDGVSLGRIATVSNPAGGGGMVAPVFVHYRMTPAAGARVFSVRGYCSSGSGTVQAGTGGPGLLVPSYMRIRRI